MRPLLALSLLLAALGVSAQQPATPATDADARASVKYSFDWIQGIPWQAYSIVVRDDGKSQFEGTPNPAETHDTDAVQQDFTMSPANREKIFNLSQKLNYFRGNFDSRAKHIAQTGTKTLAYQSPQVQGSTAFNWSPNGDIQELTRIFMGIAMTVDYGRKLSFQYRYDKLGMDKVLNELVELQADHGAEELQIIAPILRKIAGDPDMMNISRESAKRLLRTINGEGMVAPSPAPH